MDHHHQPTWSSIASNLASMSTESKPEFGGGVAQSSESKKELVRKSVSFGEFDLTSNPKACPPNSLGNAAELDPSDMSNRLPFPKDERPFSGLTEYPELSPLEEHILFSGQRDKPRREPSEWPSVSHDINGRVTSPQIPRLFFDTQRCEDLESSFVNSFQKECRGFHGKIGNDFLEWSPEAEMARQLQKGPGERQHPAYYYYGSSFGTFQNSTEQFTKRVEECAMDSSKSLTPSKAEVTKGEKYAAQPEITLKSLERKEFISRIEFFESALDCPEFVPKSRIQAPAFESNVMEGHKQQLNDWVRGPISWFNEQERRRRHPRFKPAQMPSFQNGVDYSGFTPRSSGTWLQKRCLKYFGPNPVRSSYKDPLGYPRGFPIASSTSIDMAKPRQLESKYGTTSFFDSPGTNHSDTDVTPAVSLHSTKTFWNSNILDPAAVEPLGYSCPLKDCPMMEVLFQAPSCRFLPASSRTGIAETNSSTQIKSSEIDLPLALFELRKLCSLHPSESKLPSRDETAERLTKAKCPVQDLPNVDASIIRPPPGFETVAAKPYRFEEYCFSKLPSVHHRSALPPPPPEPAIRALPLPDNEATPSGQSLLKLLDTQVMEGLTNDDHWQYKSKKMLENYHRMLEHQIRPVEKAILSSHVTEKDITNLVRGQDQLRANFQHLNSFKPRKLSPVTLTPAAPSVPSFNGHGPYEGTNSSVKGNAKPAKSQGNGAYM